MKNKLVRHPLLCWDIASQALYRRENFYDLAQFKKVHHKLKWDFEIPEITHRQFDAIVLTDTTQKILWTSSGFKSMTGYSNHYALGRTPSFLQGKNTSEEIRQKIQSALHSIQPVTATLINYRKNGTPYNCHIEILPLLSRSGTLINFMALEKEI